MNAKPIAASKIKPGDYVGRWNDTVAGIRHGDDGTIVFTMTNDGDTHTLYSDNVVMVLR
jgi:hypothetical protein